jgi:hypothetical protein
MTSNRITLFLQCVLSATLLCGGVGHAAPRSKANREPKTVVDFYLLLPKEKYFIDPKVSESERLRWAHQSPSVIDVPNGYLAMHGDGAQQSITVCLFKRPDKTYLVAVGDNEHEVFDAHLDFYEYRTGRLRPVPRSVLPVRYDPGLDYVLPRHGRTIHVIEPPRHRKYDLIWTGTRFQMRRTSRRL